MRIHFKRLAALGAAVATVIAGASTASAIVNGQPAGEGQYENVGSLLLTIPDPSGPFTVQSCTGTLIDDDLVLTAAHCLVGFPEDWVTSFTLDPIIDADQNGLVDADVTRIGATTHAHPLFASGGRNNLYDVGVLELDAPVANVDPAPLPAIGVLDSKASKGGTYIAVGYGTVRTSKTGGFSSLSVGWRREFASQTVNSVTKSWITFSMNPSTGNGGTCYGDSGGPHFAADGTVVAVTVTGDTPCRSTDKTYRIDTADAQGFLIEFLTD